MVNPDTRVTLVPTTSPKRSQVGVNSGLNRKIRNSRINTVSQKPLSHFLHLVRGECEQVPPLLNLFAPKNAKLDETYNFCHFSFFQKKFIFYIYS